MTTAKIDYQDVLSRRIDQLQTEKLKQETDLMLGFNELADSFNPLVIVKKSLHEIVDDQQVKSDLMKVSLHLGTRYLIGRIWKRQTVKSYLSAVVVEELSTTLINNGAASDIMNSLAKGATALLLKSKGSHGRS